MIKRQNGQILKPSIKVQSPGPESPLMTPRGTHKLVRFNTDIDVRRFNGYDSPSNISQNNSPINSNVSSPLSSPHESQEPQDIDDYFGYHSHSYYSEEDNFSDDSHFNDSFNTSEYTQSYISSHNISNHTTNNPIYLKSINYYDNKLVGYLNCLNLDYEKHFQLKLTFNLWKSCILFNSKFTYVKSLGDYDEFKFEINLEITKNFEFVLNYSVNNCIYWDNNNNSNYLVTMSKSSVPKFVNYTYDYNFTNNPYNNSINSGHDRLFSDLDSNYDYSDRDSNSSHIDYDYVDSFINNLIRPDHSSIVSNFCFHNEPSHSYFSLNDEIFI